MNNNSLQKKRGFTLLEMLVAVSILMVAVAAPITIAQKGLSSAVYSKDQMIASYLAQDAIEYIKNFRDQISINNLSDWAELWTSPLSLCLVSGGCEIDTVNPSFAGSYSYVRSNQDAVLTKDSNKFYGYDSTGETTKFKRKIEITNPYNSSSDEALVTVSVSWDQGSVVVNTLIFNY